MAGNLLRTYSNCETQPSSIQQRCNKDKDAVFSYDDHQHANLLGQVHILKPYTLKSEFRTVVRCLVINTVAQLIERYRCWFVKDLLMGVLVEN